MRYALVKDDIVVNIIWLYSGNKSDFPNAIPCEDIPVAIGDTYLDGIFYRNSKEVLSAYDELAAVTKVLLGLE